MTLREKYCPVHIQRLDAYIPGYQPSAEDRILKLNSNENAYPPSPRVLNAMQSAITGDLRLYPSSQAIALRDKLAEVFALPAKNIFTGNGADEIISLIYRTFTEPGDMVLFAYPTYTYYESTAQIYNINYQYIETGHDFRINLDDYTGVPSKIIFIANPNAHVGLLLAPAEIEKLLQSYSGLLVVDETYIDFSPAGSSVYQLVEKYDNLIVLRTFSKAFSLCGIRVGFGFAHPELVEALDMTKDSYNIARVNQVAAVAALEDYSYMEENSRKICATREWFREKLVLLGFSVLNSSGNFVFAKPPSGQAKYVFEGLMERKILVRYFDSRRMNEYLRISIGTREEMQLVLASIVEILANAECK